MVINIPTTDSLKLLFADFVQEKLGLTQDQVLIQNQQQGQVSFRFGKQMAFVDVQQEADVNLQYKNRREEKNEDGSITVYQTSMRTIMVGIIFYGTNCDVLASSLLDMVYQDSTKQFLAQNGMAFIPDKTQIVSPIHEQFNGQWWDRADLKLYFYGSTEVSETVETIQSLNITTKYSNTEV